MTAAEALEKIRGLASANRVFWAIGGHVDKRMRERGVQYGDIRSALMNATRAVYQRDNDRWRTEGPDLDGDELTVVVIVEADLIVCTVF